MKKKKPIFKRVWFWVLIVLIVIGVLGSAGGSDSDDKASKPTKSEATAADETEKEEEPAAEEPAKEEEPAAEEPAKEETKDVYHVGDTLHDGKMDIVYMSSGDYKEDNEFMQPADGKKYIFAQFAFINTADKGDAGISFYSFECYADGYACDAYYGGEEDLSATLSAGRSTSGYVYFEVPEDAEEVEIEYEPNFLTEKKIKFAFEGDKDSGYVLEKNTEATADAVKVGETVESKSLNVTYLSCFVDSSDNMFIEPKDGCRFITCEFEFENVSNSDEMISYFDFDCYADGRSCEASYYRDDAISVTLSSGRKAKGTVTFEVPEDATVVEVEYLTNYWTSNRVVFDASKPE